MTKPNWVLDKLWGIIFNLFADILEWHPCSLVCHVFGFDDLSDWLSADNQTLTKIRDTQGNRDYASIEIDTTLDMQ